MPLESPNFEFKTGITRAVNDYLQKHGFTKNPRPASKEFSFIRNEAMKSVLSGRDVAKGVQGRLYAMKPKEVDALRGPERVQKVFELAGLEPLFLDAGAAGVAAGQADGQIMVNIRNAMGELEMVRKSLRVRKPTQKGAAAAAEALSRSRAGAGGAAAASGSGGAGARRRRDGGRGRA